MKRYDAGNELAKSYVDRYRASGELRAVTFVRNHGFCGDWVSGWMRPWKSPTSPSLGSSAGPGLGCPRSGRALPGYLQQYAHNVNLVRWFLDAGDAVRVRQVDLDDERLPAWSCWKSLASGW